MNKHKDDLQEQLTAWIKNAYADINQHILTAAKNKGFTNDPKDKGRIFIDGKKVIMKHDVQLGRLQNFNMFTYVIYDNRPLVFRRKKKTHLASIEFSPAGYVVHLERSAIEVIKPKIIKLN